MYSELANWDGSQGSATPGGGGTPAPGAQPPLHPQPPPHLQPHLHSQRSATASASASANTRKGSGPGGHALAGGSKNVDTSTSTNTGKRTSKSRSKGKGKSEDTNGGPGSSAASFSFSFGAPPPTFPLGSDAASMGNGASMVGCEPSGRVEGGVAGDGKDETGGDASEMVSAYTLNAPLGGVLTRALGATRTRHRPERELQHLRSQ